MQTPPEKRLTSGQRLNWPLFLGVLLAPVVLTILAASLIPNDYSIAVASLVGFVGGGISGVLCGRTLGKRLGKTERQQTALGILFAGVFAVVCIGMCCFGCLSGIGVFNR